MKKSQTNRANKKTDKKSEKRVKINSNLKRIIAAIAALLLLIVVCVELYSMSSSNIKTQTAVVATYKNSISTKMFAVRDEALVSGAVGTVVSAVADGERVAGGQAIAARFSTADSAVMYTELEQLKAELARYENLNNQQNLSTMDISKLNSDIDVLFSDMVRVADSGELRALPDAAESFSDRLTTKQIFVNGNIDFTDKIASLRSQIAALESKVGNVEYIKSSDTGYYVSSADGYEDAVNFSKITSLNSADVKSLLESKPKAVPDNTMGKLIKGYSWYFVGVISESEAVSINDGDSVKLICANASRGYIDAKVYHKGDIEGGSAVLILSSKIMDEDISRLRVEDVEIVFSETTGIRVGKDAVRVVNGVQGVYVLTGNLVSFKKLDIIYSADDYVISKKIYDTVKDEDKIPYVKLYDEVIVEGKNLSDGKIIN